jgi:hypothetical protein
MSTGNVGQIVLDTAMERYVLSGVTLWFLVLATVTWYRPSRSELPERSGQSAEALQNVIKKQWSQVRNASEHQGFSGFVEPFPIDLADDDRCETQYTCCAFPFVKFTCYRTNTSMNTFGNRTTRSARTPISKSGCSADGPTLALSRPMIQVKFAGHQLGFLACSQANSRSNRRAIQLGS